MLLGTLGASLLGDVLSKGLSDRGVIRAGEGTIRAGYGSKRSSLKVFLILPHPLTNFEIQAYYQNKPSFNGVFSRDNLPNSNNNNNNNNNIKNGAYVINLDEYRNIGTHWVALYVNDKTIIYFDSFGVEHIPKEIMKFVGNKNIITNIFKVQIYDSIMCGDFCIGFINFMFNGDSLTDYTSLFSLNGFKKNDDIIHEYFGIGCKMSDSNLEVSKANRENEMSELNDLTT